MDKNKEKSIFVSGVSAGNIISAEKAVMPANYAAANSKTGHGIMAEEAQTILDKLRFKQVDLVGRSNIKNGADRIVDGALLQTKFYNSGKSCVSACFDKNNDGVYKYIDQNGEPMLIEVPKDMYDDAVSAFSDKIAKGKVPGITDESMAENFIYKSDLTYQNSLNLCKPLTMESLLFDMLTGLFSGILVFLITGFMSFIILRRATKDTKKAVKTGVKTASKVFILSYLLHIFCSQVSRTEWYKSMFDITQVINHDGFLGSTVKSINNGIRYVVGDSLSSTASAFKQMSKMIRAGSIINLISIFVFVIPDTIRVIMRRISGFEYFYRVISIVSSKVFASTSFVVSGMLLSSFTAMPTIINMSFSVAMACLGGMFGNKIINKLFYRFNRNKVIYQ